ncbi:MAG: hypothetical protein H6739_40890 [Alphaproteobacteria bacterium]|nr:hypothetical protein [Alphaproteobacteria bacterium]
MRVLLPLTALAALTACTGKDAVDSTPPDVAWYGEVEDTVIEKCATCHQPGGLGPGDWSTYETAAAGAEAIKVYVENGAMPLAAADPECRSYHGAERMHLTDEETQRIIDWADAGAPAGNPAHSNAPEIPYLHLDDTDTTLEMPLEHTLEVDEGDNEYFCMILDNPFTETRYVTGIDVEVGNREVVHHMLLAVDMNGNAGVGYGTDGTQTAFRCQDPILESDWLLLHAWTPGMEPVEFPDGVGLQVNPGDQLVLQMHYYADHDLPAQTDHSAYKLRTTDHVNTVAEMAAVGPDDFRIPAGADSYSDSESLENDFGRMTLYGAFPHMHLLGSYFSSSIRKMGGSEECLVRGEYDFDHQMTYMFDVPVQFNRRDRLVVECTWNNAADAPNQYNDPPQDIVWGEGSNAEMCYMLFYYSMGQ